MKKSKSWRPVVWGTLSCMVAAVAGALSFMVGTPCGLAAVGVAMTVNNAKSAAPVTRVMQRRYMGSPLQNGMGTVTMSPRVRPI
jgi:citrate synthase